MDNPKHFYNIPFILNSWSHPLPTNTSTTITSKSWVILHCSGSKLSHGGHADMAQARSQLLSFKGTKADVDTKNMDMNEGGLHYSDHLYFDIVTLDDDEPEVEMSSMVGRCPEVTLHTDEGTDGTLPTELVDLRRSRGTTQEDEEMPDYDDESL
ncbi:hypothetical protein ACLB2K_021160 [Fragaria x ananassa]